MKRIIALMIVLAAALSFAACGATDMDVFVENRMVSLSSKNDDGSLVRMTEYVCDEDYAFAVDEGIFYLKSGVEGDHKLYVLDSADKMGFSIPLESIAKEAEAFDYSFEPYKALGAKKIGSGKIAGRPADIFLWEYNGVRIKFWVDKKSDVILKLVTVNEAGEEVPDADDAIFAGIGVTPHNFEVMDIVVGGVAPADIANLEDYTIVSAGDFLGGLMGDPFGELFGAGFYDAFGKAFGSSFEEALGGTLGDALGDAIGSAIGEVVGAFEALGDRIGNAIERIFSW